jgi:hypothetical protein
MSEARRLGDLLPALLVRARRTAKLSAFLDEFDDPGERKDVIMRLYQGGVISASTAELFIDVHGVKSA